MVILFIPKSANCLVKNTWTSFDIYNEVTKILIENTTMLLAEYLDLVFEGNTRPEKKIVFAHGTEAGKGILSLHDNTLNPEWWIYSPPFKIAVFHACYGAKTLLSNKYATIFPDWLSYNNKIHVLEGDIKKIKPILDFWKKTFIAMINAVKESDSGEQVKAEFERIYIDGILKVDKFRIGQLGELTKSHLARAMVALQSKN